MKNNILLTFLLIFFTFSSKAQSKTYYALGDKIATAIFRQFQSEKCPDSIAMYSFAVKIDIDCSSKNNRTIKINVDDSLFYKMFKDISVIKTYDYSGLMVGRTHADLILPLGVIVLSTKSSSFKPSIDIHTIEFSIDKLLHIDKEMGSKIYFRPFLIRAELKPTD